MSDDKKTTGRRPSHTVYFVQDRDSSPWVPIGAAWGHQDGEGFSLRLDLLPNVAGRVLLRTIKAKEAGQ